MIVMSPEESGDISAGLEFYRDMYFISLPVSNSIHNYETSAEHIIWRTAEYYSFEEKPYCNTPEKGIMGEISILPENIVSFSFSNRTTERGKRGGQLITIYGQYPFTKTTLKELEKQYDFFDPNYLLMKNRG